MRKTLCITLIASCIVMASGCGTKGGTEEKAVEALVQEPVEAVPDIPDEVQEPASAEGEETEGEEKEDTETGDTGGTEDAASAYSDILDMFYYKILTGWDCTEDVSYMFYWDYSSVKSLSDAGYALTDLDGNGVPELLVSPVEDAGNGMIYDLYACVDGKIVHTASSGERFCYYLCEDNSIYYWDSSGASNKTQVNYGLDADTGLLYPKEVVIYDENEDKESPWFYGTEECYDKESGFQFDKMSGITEGEAADICSDYKVSAIKLTLFDEYAPQEDIPADVMLKSAFHEAAGEERELFRADAQKKIKELECIAKKDDVVSRQFLVARKANWIEKSDEYSRNEIMDMLLGAIRLTVPQFDLDEINRCLYSENEISLIIDIAVQYSRSGQRRKAEDILRQLIKMLQKRYPNHIRLPLAAYNYAIYLCLERRYEESLEIVELGRTTAIKQKHYLSLPGFLHIEAECRYFMGEVGTSEKLYRSAYHIYKAIDDLDNLKILVREAKERLNLTF